MHTELAWVAVAPAFALICIGIAVRRIALVNAAFWPSAEKLTHYVLFPAFLVHSIGLAGPLDASSKSTILLLTGLTLAVLAAVVLGCRLCAVPHASFTSIVQGSIRFNSYIFLSVASGLLSRADYGIAAVVVAYMVAISNTLVLLSFEHGQAGGRGLVGIVGKVAANPLIVASAFGIVLNLTGWRLPAALDQTVDVLGGAALPLSLICVGAALRLPLPRKEAALVRAGLVTTAIRLVGFPLLALTATKAFAVSPLSGNLILLYSVLPCASNSYVLSTQYGGNHRLMAFVVALSTVLSFVPIFIVARAM